MITEFELMGTAAYLLSNGNMSMLIHIVNGKPLLLHCGSVISAADASAMCLRPNPGWGTTVLYKEGDTSSSLDIIPLIWSEENTGDYRENPVSIGIPADFTFRSGRIIDGLIPIESELPQADGASQSLELTFLSGTITLRIIYSVYETAICCRTVISSSTELVINRLMSSMLDLKGSFDITTLDGAWIREAHTNRIPVSYSRVVNESSTGFSSNRHNPGFLLSRPDATEFSGEVYGFNQIYSGNHYASAQISAQNFTRVMLGISPVSFPRSLNAGESFETPQAVISYSAEGFNGLSCAMHSFVNSHIVPEYWRFMERPVLYNSWEGCLFDFNESKLLSLASKAKKLGCELFVLDDGWFGARNSDTAGLGDYTVNKKKLPGGLEGLSSKLGRLGLKFGLWFEPEAVNPDSELYRAHPDWALHPFEGSDFYSRNELLLDLTRSDVRDYIVENVSSIIDSANVSYVKWDMNRHLPISGPKAHDYILGLYEVQRRIFKPRPSILLENCASGGNRFDLGMLCFGAQIWASDNTDPIERLDIQNGLSYLYPQSCWGSHVSASPHSQTLRTTPLSTDANAAFFGDFGLELELSHLLPVEEKEIKAAVEFYKGHRKTFQFGILSREETEPDAVCWLLSSEEESIAGLFHRLVHSAQGYEWLKLRGFEPSQIYRITSRPQNLRVGRFGGLVKYISPVDINPNGVALRTADRLYPMKDGAEDISCTGAALSAGIPLALKFMGTGYDANLRNQGDFGSNIYVIEKVTDK